MTDDTRTHWKLLINPDYIGAYSLPPGEDMTVTIRHVTRQIVKGQEGKEEECTVAHLVDQKPFILNRTNSKSIAKLYGPYIEDWRGKQITLFATKTKVAREVVECLRIRATVTAVDKPKPAISDDRLTKALESIMAGQINTAYVRERFTLTQEQEEKLKAHDA